MKFSAEQIKKAKEAKTAGELSALAKENGAELTEAQAEALFASLGKDGELSDSELEAIAGGKGEEPETVHPEPKYKAGECYWIISRETWGTIMNVSWGDYINEWIYSIQLAPTLIPDASAKPTVLDGFCVDFGEKQLTNDISLNALS